jgi:protein involved in sex pheromone biosynthesis
MTAAASQSLGISDDTKERLNRLVIGLAKNGVDNYRKRRSRLSSPADL